MIELVTEAGLADLRHRIDELERQLREEASAHTKAMRRHYDQLTEALQHARNWRESHAGQTANTLAFLDECETLRKRIAEIAGHFNSWSNGNVPAEKALSAIGGVLGPPCHG